MFKHNCFIFTDPPPKKRRQSTLDIFVSKFTPLQTTSTVEINEESHMITLPQEVIEKEIVPSSHPCSERNHPEKSNKLIELTSTTQQPNMELFQPMNIEFPKRNFGKQNRSFQSCWFREFPWLHYRIESDTVVCFICKKQNSLMNLDSARNKENAFISDGFSNWKKATMRFREHQLSECHKTAINFEVTIPSTHRPIMEMFSESMKKDREDNRRCLIKLIENVQYLGRQGQAIQGDTDEESNFFQLIKLRARDDAALTQWIKRRGSKYTSHDIQNEILSIMSQQIIRTIVSKINHGKHYALICDEYTDISNKEQLSLCLRWVDEDLNIKEDFIGFYHLHDIKAETIFSAINDILLRLQLPLNNCRGQCYDGAANMMGCKTGVAKKIQSIQPNAFVTHCHGHSLSLGVKDMISKCKLVSDTLDTAKEIVTLIKYSPFRENLLGEIKDNIEGEESDSYGIIMFCPTRWTIRSTCCQRILDNYSALFQEWDICLSMKLQSDVRCRIIGVQAQMQNFDFFFGLHLAEKIFRHTDNLAKALQKTKVSATEGQHLAEVVKKTLQSKRNDEIFVNFYTEVLHQQKLQPDISVPTLPRRKNVPAIYQIGSGTPSFPSNPEDHYRSIYFEAFDLIIAAIDQRFQQESFITYMKLESLLLKSLKKENTNAEFKFVSETYSSDLDINSLQAQLHAFSTLCQEHSQIKCFNGICEKVRTFSLTEKLLVEGVVTICKLISVNPATSASSERSFSAARRLKTWLRASMTQERFNSIAVLNIHKEKNDELCLLTVANEFVSRNERRKVKFGTFSKNDFNRC